MSDTTQSTPECCDNTAIDYAHCNNCYAVALALLSSGISLSTSNHSHYNQIIPADFYYPEPALELFKPPI